MLVGRMLRFACLLDNTGNGGVIRDIYFIADGLFNLLCKLSLDLLCVPLVLLINLLEVVLVVLVLVFGTMSTCSVFTLLLSLLLGNIFLNDCGASLFNLLLLSLLIAVSQS